MENDASKNLPSPDGNHSIKIHNFSATFLDKIIYFHVMRMQDSLLVWIGRKPEMSNLSVAMCTKFETTPAVSRLMGELSELTSSTLAQKLARKTKKQCFVSYTLPPENGLLEFVEKRLIQEINEKPNQF